MSFVDVTAARKWAITFCLGESKSRELQGKGSSIIYKRKCYLVCEKMSPPVKENILNEIIRVVNIANEKCKCAGSSGENGMNSVREGLMNFPIMGK